MIRLAVGIAASTALAGVVFARPVKAVKAVRRTVLPRLERRQPPVERLFDWDGRIVVQADRFYAVPADGPERFFARRLRVQSAPLVPIPPPPGVRMEELAMAFGRAWALCRAPDRSWRLYERRDGEWQRGDAPEKVWQEHKRLRLVGSPKLLLAVSRFVVFKRYRDGAWQAVAREPKVEGQRPYWTEGRQRLALAGTRLYVGFDKGAQGGGLFSTNVASPDRKWLHVSDQADPNKGYNDPDATTDVLATPDDHVYVTTGMTDLNRRNGGLYRFDGQAWQAIVQQRGNSAAENTTALPRESELVGLSVGPDGRVFILTAACGLLVLDPAEGLLQVLNTQWYSRGTWLGPRGLLQDAAGQHYVGTVDAGVLRFSRDQEGRWRIEHFALPQLQSPPKFVPGSKP